MIDKLSITVHGFPLPMLTSLSVDEIFLPRYMNCNLGECNCYSIAYK